MRDIFNNLGPADRICDPIGQMPRKQMKSRLPERFYKEVSMAPVKGGFAVLLDGSKVMTPARCELVLPTGALARLVAGEFCLQEEVINPAKMPVTRLANTVIDGIAGDPQPVIEDILRFVAADMLFYRVESPRELAMQQSEQWDPVLDWAAREMGAYFITAERIMHIEQPQEAIAAVSLYLRRFTSPFALTALHTMTTLTGSALIALGMAAGEIDVARGWRLAHLDENWTIERWGKDAEAEARRSCRENEICAAAAVLAAS